MEDPRFEGKHPGLRTMRKSRTKAREPFPTVKPVESVLKQEAVPQIEQIAEEHRYDGQGGGGLVPTYRTFDEVERVYLRFVQRNTDPNTWNAEEKDEYKKVLEERERLIHAAKDAGIFKEIKQRLENIQQDVGIDQNSGRDYSFAQAIQDVASLVDKAWEYEIAAKALPGWDDRFEGMIKGYVEAAVAIMASANARATGKQNRDLDKWTDAVSFGVPSGVPAARAAAYYTQYALIHNQPNVQDPNRDLLTELVEINRSRTVSEQHERDVTRREKIAQQLSSIRALFKKEFEPSLDQIDQRPIDLTNIEDYIGDENARILAIRNRIASILPLKTKGPDGIAEIKLASLTKDDLQALMNDKVYAITLSTLIHELYTIGPLNSSKQNSPQAYGLILTDQGTKIMSGLEKDTNRASYRAYKEHLKSRIQLLLVQNPNLIRFRVGDAFVDPAKIAEGYVGAALDFLSLGLACESGDVDRKVANTNPFAIVGSMRAMLHMFKHVGSKQIREETMKGTEETVFSIFGTYLSEELRSNKRFERGFDSREDGYRFLPEALCGSMFDHVLFDNGMSLAEYMVRYSNQAIHVGQNQFVYGLSDHTPNVFASHLRNDDLIKDYYGDILGSVSKIAAIFNAKQDAKAAQASLNDFIEAINNLQGKAGKGDRIFQALASPRNIGDVLVAAIGIVHGGFIPHIPLGDNGKPFMIMKMGNYDTNINRLLGDEKRIYRILGANPGTQQAENIRQYLLKVFVASDYSDKRLENPWYGGSIPSYRQDDRQKMLRASKQDR